MLCAIQPVKKALAFQSGSGGMYAGTKKSPGGLYLSAFAARAPSERQSLHKREKVAIGPLFFDTLGNACCALFLFGDMRSGL